MSLSVLLSLSLQTLERERGVGSRTQEKSIVCDVIFKEGLHMAASSLTSQAKCGTYPF